jgi:hypothetical protein
LRRLSFWLALLGIILAASFYAGLWLASWL